MADKQISQLPLNPTLTGTEEKAVERGGSNYKQTTDQEKDFFQENLTFVEGVTGDGVDNTDPKNPILEFPDTSEVDETTDKKYVTDAEKVVIGNTSGSNTGDETTGTIQTKRPIKTVDGQSLEGTGNINSTDTTYTDAEIKTKYEANADTNAFTDAEQTKLTSVEAGAEVNQTDAEIKVQYEANADTNAFTDAEQTKLTGVEAGAEVNQTDAEIKVQYEANADTNAFTDAEKTKVAIIQTGGVATNFLDETGNYSEVITSDPLKINYTDNPTKTQTGGIIAFDDTTTNSLYISVNGIPIP